MEKEKTNDQSQQLETEQSDRNESFTKQSEILSVLNEPVPDSIRQLVQRLKDIEAERKLK